MTTYTEQLQSEAWQQKRLEKLASVGYRCEECGKSEPLDIHHKVYTFPLGQEPLNALEALCKDTCHPFRHDGREFKPCWNCGDLVMMRYHVHPIRQYLWRDEYCPCGCMKCWRLEP